MEKLENPCEKKKKTKNKKKRKQVGLVASDKHQSSIESMRVSERTKKQYAMNLIRFRLIEYERGEKDTEREREMEEERMW